MDEKRVREWKGQEMELEEMMHKQGKMVCKVRKRIRGGGRKVHFPKQEKLIAERILQQRALRVRVLRRDVARIAKEIITDPHFSASPGWISKFMRRYRFVTRVKTTAGQSLPKNVSERIIDYVTNCRKTDNKESVTAQLHCEHGRIKQLCGQICQAIQSLKYEGHTQYKLQQQDTTSRG